jgi:ubiquinone/menaquinone biosynthesis C-methylase UbiE
MSQTPEPADHDHQDRSGGGALAADFDHDAERFAANQLATQNFSIVGDVHDRVADRLAKITNGPILDLGGGNGTLAKSLAKHCRSAIVVDRAEYVRSAPRPAVQADATRLPFRSECFAAVAALWMLYYLDRPAVALTESDRVCVREEPSSRAPPVATTTPNSPACSLIGESRSASTPRPRQRLFPITSRSPG